MLTSEQQKALDQQKETDLQKTLQALQEQLKQSQEQGKLLQEELNKQRSEKEEVLKKAAEDKKKVEQTALENASDLDKLLEGFDKSSESDKEGKKPVDQLSNEELLSVVGETVEKFVDAKIKLDRADREKTQDGFLKKLSNVESLLGHMVAAQSVQDLQAKYPDFALFKEDIIKIVGEHPTLSLEKAYKLAKAEKIDSEPASNQVESEHPEIGPNGLPAIPKRKGSEADNQSNVSTSGLTGFRTLLDQGAARALANRTKR